MWLVSWSPRSLKHTSSLTSSCAPPLPMWLIMLTYTNSCCLCTCHAVSLRPHGAVFCEHNSLLIELCLGTDQQEGSLQYEESIFVSSSVAIITTKPCVTPLDHFFCIFSMYLPDMLGKVVRAIVTDATASVLQSSAAYPICLNSRKSYFCCRESEHLECQHGPRI